MRLSRWKTLPALLVILALGTGLALGRSDAGGLPALCGNGVLDAGETCDDGNIFPGDCCSETCTQEESRYGDERNSLCVNSAGQSRCEDGIDNDGDGYIDAERASLSLPVRMTLP